MHIIDILISAVESAGFPIYGPTDVRVAEHGEPVWVCAAREAIADIAQQLAEQQAKG